MCHFRLQLAWVLHHLAQQNVVHLDIKPDNILVDFLEDTSVDALVAMLADPSRLEDVYKRLRIKLCDFGLATESGAIKRCGTPGYWSPEQALRGFDLAGNSFVGVVGTRPSELRERLADDRPQAVTEQSVSIGAPVSHTTFLPSVCR